MSNNKRIRLLSDPEIKALYGLPELNEEEQQFFFELSHQEESLLQERSHLVRKIYTILLLGYFKCKQQFFQFELSEVHDDVRYIIQRYFPHEHLDKITLGREAKRQSQSTVLKLTGYRLYSQSRDGAALLDKALELCRISVDPVFLIRELLTLLINQKISIPGYTTLQEKVVSKALVLEQERISALFKTHLTKSDKKHFFSLFKQDDKFYALTALKKDPKNFRLTAIRKEVQQFHQFRSLHMIAVRILPHLQISRKAILYYASLVEYYTIQGLDRIDVNQTCLWLLCFILQRYQSMLDNLATMFIYTVDQYETAVKERAEELFLKEVMESAEQNSKIAKLLRMYTDKQIDPEQAFALIRDKAYKVLPVQQINQVADELEDKNQEKKRLALLRWQAIDALANTYLPRLRTLITIFTFEGEQHQHLHKACQFLQDALSAKRSLAKIAVVDFPQQFIPARSMTAIYDAEGQKSINLNRYEYECYRQVGNYVNGRSLFIAQSSRYRSLESELLPNWQEDKEKIIEKANRPLLKISFAQFIEEKVKPLDQKIFLVNEAICNGDNPYLKIKQQKDGSLTWTLPYTKRSEDLKNPFYEKLPSASIFRVLQFVNQHTGFMQQFTHIKPHYAKSKQDELSIYGCLVANGTNLGVGKMADLCDFPLSGLIEANKSYIRLSTLRAANDVISNSITSLPIFKHWNINPDLLHASIDGIKMATEREIISVRYSPKYFGFEKGTVGLSFIINFVPANAMIIGANEHESHFIFDLVYNNSSEPQPDIVSTDTEGSNQLNYLLLFLIEMLYAPRYRSLRNKTESIISYTSSDKFKDLLIKPDRRFHEKLVLSEEDNIKHILASLLMGEVNQSNIVAKLSSKQFSSRTKQALWEMNAALMSDHLLNCINDVGFRQSIQTALNRGEAYHQLRRHIEKVNGRRLRGSSQSEIMVWNECARLLSNCVIYYNAVILNSLLKRAEKLGDEKLCAFIKKLSPIAWTHINFQGKYELYLAIDGKIIDIEELLSQFDIFKTARNQADNS